MNNSNSNNSGNSGCGLIIIIILIILMCGTCVGTCSGGSSSKRSGYSQAEWDEAERAVREANDRYYRTQHWD